MERAAGLLDWELPRDGLHLNAAVRYPLNLSLHRRVLVSACGKYRTGGALPPALKRRQ